jgi:hypothetical protein
MKPEPPASAHIEVAQLIRAYLTAHPRAADTAEGIQRWWIAPMFGEVSLWSVEQALARLEGEGVVRKLDWSAASVAYERGPNFVGAAGDRDGQ